MIYYQIKNNLKQLIQVDLRIDGKVVSTPLLSRRTIVVPEDQITDGLRKRALSRPRFPAAITIRENRAPIKALKEQMAARNEKRAKAAREENCETQPPKIYAFREADPKAIPVVEAVPPDGKETQKRVKKTGRGGK